MRREVEENESSCLEVIAYLGEWWGVVGGWSVASRRM